MNNQMWIVRDITPMSEVTDWVGIEAFYPCSVSDHCRFAKFNFDSVEMWQISISISTKFLHSSYNYRPSQ